MEMLEKGLVIGSIVLELEKQNIINFTCYMDYDGEFLELAKQLIEEFGTKEYQHIHCFSQFVETRLKEMQKELDDKSNIRS